MTGVYNFLTKHGQVVSFGLGLVLTLLFYAIVGGGLEEFNGVEEKLRPKSDEGGIFMFGLRSAAGLAILCVLAMLGFGIYQMATNPKGAIKGIISLVALAVVFGIAYATSSNEILDTWNTEDVITPGISQYVGGAIKTTGVLIGIVVLAFVVSEIRNFFK